MSNGEKAKSEPDSERLVHDIITNIVILTIPDSCLPDGFDHQRTRNAVLSAMAAIRAETALLFQVESRDIGALLHEDHLSPSHRGKYSIIIYDNASGGGGLVLPLLKKEDSPIPEILGNALKRCRECPECGKGIDDAMQSRMPVDEAEYRNAVQKNGGLIPGAIRLRAACPKCLKQRDNAREAHLLDRFDAARVIENLLDPKLEIKIVDTKPVTPVTSAPLAPKQNQGSLAQILDKLIAHPNRNATEVDKRFVSAFRSAIGDDVVATPTVEKEFNNGEVKAKALLCWDEAKIAVFSSAKSDTVNLIRPAFDGWLFVVISDHVDMAELKARL